MTIRAVVAVGARREVDVMTPVMGVPLLRRALECLLDTGAFDDVQVLVGVGARHEAVAYACAELAVDVVAHADQRASTTNGDDPVTVYRPDVLLVHDAACPFTPPSLIATVVEAVVAGHDVAVPVLPLPDTVKTVDGGGLVTSTPDRSGLRVLQSPVAFRTAALAGRDPTTGTFDTVRELAAAGARVRTVPGDPMAFTVRSPWELALAGLIAQGGHP